MHHRNRATPIALARQPPVAQAIVGDPLTPALSFGKIDGRIDGLLPGGDVEPGEVVDPSDGQVLGRNKRHRLHRRWVVERHERVDHRQVILPAEIEVALIVRRAGENRPGAIVHQNEIGDPDRQFPIGVQRMAHPQPGVDPQLFGLFQRFLGGAALGRLGAERGNLAVGLGQVLGQRVVGRDAHE